MRGRLPGWWRLRTGREQRLLLAAAVLAASMLLWLLVVRPLEAALDDARDRHDRAVQALAEARAQVAAIRRLQSVRPPALPAPLQVHLGQLASDAGFTVARMEPVSPRQVNIVVDAARAPALFAWLAALESGHGLIVDRLSARANSDATIAVEVSMRTRRG